MTFKIALRPPGLNFAAQPTALTTCVKFVFLYSSAFPYRAMIFALPTTSLQIS